MLPEHANTDTRTKRKRDMNNCSVPINQGRALIRVYACFIRNLVCSKKNYHLALKINNLLSNHIFCILEPLKSSDNIFKKRNYNYVTFIAIFVLCTPFSTNVTAIVIQNCEPPV